MLLNKDIEEYITRHTTVEDSILSELNRETYVKALNPRMISGHPQGKFLEMISRIINPDKILEIGTYTGYSAICLARGLKKGGELHTIERNDELSGLQEKYFRKAGLEKSIIRHLGDAKEIIPKLNYTFDLVFIDADKGCYPDFFELVSDKLEPGGIVITDNVLWDGKVVKSNKTDDYETIAIKKFNKMVVAHPNYEVIMLPIRDGISIVRKFF